MTTELSQLPSDPNVMSGGSAPQNTIIEAPSFQNNFDEKKGVPPPMDHKGMTGMVSQLELLSKQGVTQLQAPPTNTGFIATDPQQIPTMVPGQQMPMGGVGVGTGSSVGGLVPGGQNPHAAITQSLQPSMMPAPSLTGANSGVGPGISFAPTHDYIGEESQRNEEKERIDRMQSENQQDTLETIIDHIKVPIFVASLFFLFQMPVIKQFFFTKLPTLFSKDANLTTNGMLFMSLLFGGAYYAGNHIVKSLDL